MNLEVLDGTAIDGNQIESAISSAPFLGDKRLVIIKNYLSANKVNEEGQEKSPDQRKTSTVLDNVPDFCVLVFAENNSPDKRLSLYKKIKKIGQLVEFPTISGTKLLSWIQKEVRKLNADIEERAAITLSELVGGDLSRMSNELGKLSNYAEHRKINDKDIELLVDTALVTSIFKLTDALATKNSKRCIKIMHQLIDSGEDLHHILFMIIRQFRMILQVKDFMAHKTGKNEIITKLGVHPYAVSATMSQCGSFSFSELQDLYGRLLEIDKQMKTGGIKTFVGDNRELVLALDRLILGVCNKKNANNTDLKM